MGQGARAIPGSTLDDVLAKPGDDALEDRRARHARALAQADRRRAREVGHVRADCRQDAAATIPPPKRGGPGAGPLGAPREQGSAGGRATRGLRGRAVGAPELERVRLQPLRPRRE